MMLLLKRESMLEHKNLNNRQLHFFIRNGSITLGGNKRLKIYGLLNCRSGKKLLKENRVFFLNAKEAENSNYRPCGHCMKREYLIWKKANGSL